MATFFEILASFGISSTDLKYLSIPIVSSLSGWATNWLAIQMSFYPINFVGIKPYFGWQGIIPSKSKKMSSIFISKALLHIGNLSDVFSRFEIHKIAIEHMQRHADEIDHRIAETIEQIAPGTWNSLPKFAKSAILRRIKKEIPTISNNIARDLTSNINYFIDIRELMISQLTKDKSLLVSMIKELGQKEISFAINSGIPLGCLFGTFQMIAWYYYPSPWILPFFGVLVGTCTNWMVLNMIFRPLHPVKIFPEFRMGSKQFGPYYAQGLFLKRQNEVAISFSQVVTERLLTVSIVMRNVFNGHHQNEAIGIIRKHLKPYLESHWIKLLLQTIQGLRGYAAAKRDIEDQCLTYFLESLSQIDSDSISALKAQPFFIDKIKSLPPENFQDMLRPAFQEDEWILIFLGGVLGGLVGFMQFIYIFA